MFTKQELERMIDNLNHVLKDINKDIQDYKDKIAGLENVRTTFGIEIESIEQQIRDMEGE